MSQHPIMEKLHAKLQRKDFPKVNAGDTVRVQVKIKEGDKERVQAFEGTGVERIFPFNSKVVDKVEVLKSNQVRRAKLFYLRGLRGKAARLREIDTRIKTKAAAAPAKKA
jgi:large subunit ribosomal protein L19